MLKGINEKGELKNIKVSDNGEVLVKMNNEGSTEEKTTQAEIVNTAENPVQVEVKNQVTAPSEIKVNNTSENAIPVSVQGVEKETTLNSSIQTIGTTATTISINKKVTEINIANYSEEADVTLAIGETSFVIGSNIATTLKINKQVTNISLTSTEADTKVQIIVSGVE